MDLKKELTDVVLKNFMNEAKKQTPVITGNLKSHWDRKDNNIINDCEYAVIVNYRNTPNSQNPYYFNKAVNINDKSKNPKIREVMKRYLKGLNK